MAAHIPSDMLPRMDWKAEDKLAVWTFFRERLEQYFMIASTPEATKVTHILFYGGKEPSDRWTALKDQVDETKLKDAETVFKAFANSFEKSSSHWQARDEYLADIKQAKHQTMAELDIYIKNLVRRCQFNQTEQELHKIDLFYHATAHFKVRKFVHNAEPEELTYDKMIELAKAHERAYQEYHIHKQAHSMAPPSNYSNPLLQTSTLSKSFQKGPPKKTCGKCGHSHNHGECPAHGTTYSICGKKNHWASQCITSRRRHSSSGPGPPSPGRPQKQRQRRLQQGVQQRQGMRRRRQWQQEQLYSQKTRCWMGM